jgi:uncharacterized protein (DUF1697 family)
MKQISLLRGINVGGHNKVPMAELKMVYESLGLKDVTTYIQSGNVVFSGGSGDPGALAADISEALLARFGTTIAVVVRSAGEWEEMMALNPFAEEAATEPAKLAVLFADKAPGAGEIARLGDLPPHNERFAVINNHIYCYYPDGMGRSKLTGELFDRKLGVTSTARNWSTVCRLMELACK